MNERGLSAVALELGGVAATICLTLPAARPLLRDGLPATWDGPTHALRFAAFVHDLHDGWLFPRWDASLHAGYGSPVFQFAPPLSYYLAEALHLLGQDVNGALRLAFASTILLSALAMYVLARAFAGRSVSLLAGVGYATLPFLMHTVYVRGSLPEANALWLMPAALSGLTQFAVGRGRWWLAVAVAAAAGVALSSSGLLWWFLSLSVVWTAGLAIMLQASTRQRAIDDPPSAAAMPLAVCLGVGVASFFLIPALLETSFVHESLAGTGHVVPSSAASSWYSVQSTWIVDYQRDASAMIHPGLVQIVLAFLGTICFGLRHARAHSLRPTLWLLALIPLAVGMLAFQAWLPAFMASVAPIETLGLALGPFGLIAALIASFVVEAASWRPVRAALAIAFAVLSLVATTNGLPVASASGWTQRVDERSVLTDTLSTQDRALTSLPDFLPSTVRVDQGMVLATLSQPRSVDDPGPLSLSDVSVVSASSKRLVVVVRTPSPATLVLRQFYMPGWHALEGNDLMPTRPIGELGLLGVDVPAGKTDLSLTYERTPLETASLLASVCAVLSAIWWIGFPRPLIRSGPRLTSLRIAAIGLPSALPLLLLLPTPPPTPVQLNIPRPLAPGYQLAGVQVDEHALARQRTVRFTLFVAAKRTGVDMLFHVAARDVNGAVVAEVTERPWNGPTGFWIAGELAPAMLDLTLSQTATNPSRYSIDVSDSRQPGVTYGNISLRAGSDVRGYVGSDPSQRLGH